MIHETELTSVNAVLQYLKQKGEDNELIVGRQGTVILNGKTYDQRHIKLVKAYQFEYSPGIAEVIYIARANDGTMGYGLDTYSIYASRTNNRRTMPENRTAADQQQEAI